MRTEKESELNYTAKDRKTPPPQPVLFQLYEEEPGGRRPASVAEPPGPQDQVQRHTMEQLADVAPMVPSLGVPEAQMVDQLVAMVKHVGSVVPEQIFAVPKISWPSRSFLVRFSVSRRRRNSWWKCLSLPPVSHRCRWCPSRRESDSGEAAGQAGAARRHRVRNRSEFRCPCAADGGTVAEYRSALRSTLTCS